MSPTTPEGIVIFRTVQRLGVALLVAVVVGCIILTLTWTRMRDAEERGNELQACRAAYSARFIDALGDEVSILTRALAAVYDEGKLTSIAEEGQAADLRRAEARNDYIEAVDRSVSEPKKFLADCRQYVQ